MVYGEPFFAVQRSSRGRSEVMQRSFKARSKVVQSRS
jgi:hypothetical protein